MDNKIVTRKYHEEKIKINYIVHIFYNDQSKTCREDTFSN